ncbi:MAG: hypothetical protein ACTSRP_13255 [Candidatus Helarchaeota archaeon]
MNAFGTGVQPTCFMQPFYPFFLALLYLIFNDWSLTIGVVQLIQTIIGSLTGIYVYKIGKKIFNESVARMSALIYIFYPDFLYSAYVAHQLVFTTFFVVFLIYLSICLFHEFTQINALKLGVAGGFSLYVEPILISLLGVILLSIFFIVYIQNKGILHFQKNEIIKSERFLRNLKIVGLVSILIIGIISPWLIRCYVVSGRFVFMKGTGFNLWRGNNPEYYSSGVPSWPEPEEYEKIIKEAQSDKEADIDVEFGEQAIENILTHPVQALQMVFMRILFFWWAPPVLPEQNPPSRMMIYATLLVCAIVGLFSTLRKKENKRAVVLLFPALAFTAVYSISFVLPRYRVPIDPINFIFAGVFLNSLIKKLFPKFFLQFFEGDVKSLPHPEA